MSGAVSGSLLCVCTGNLCRSPFAERRLRQITAGTGIEVASAGVAAVVGAPIDPPMAAALRARGADADGFAARQLTADLLRPVDLVLTATQAHRDAVARLRPALVNRVFTFAQAAAIAPRLDTPPVPDLAGFSRALAAGRWLVRTTAADDIVDPLGRDPEAYQRCVESLDAAVTAIAGALTGSLASR